MTSPTVRQIRLEYAMLIVCLALAVMAQAQCGAVNVNRNGSRTMRCFSPGKVATQERLAALKDTLLPPLDRQLRFFATNLRIESERPWSSDDILAIYSHRAGGLLSFGPFAPELLLYASASYSEDGGHDILSFTVLNPGLGQICVWAGDVGFPLWRKDQRVTIRLLNDLQFDVDGVGRSYEVESLR